MSMTFTKLFSSITESTIWCEDSDTRIVWVTMLAMADKRGRIWSSIPGLAKRAAVSLEKTEIALRKFLSPDPYSRTKDYEGRRIEEIDGGWRLLNYEKYREIRDSEERKAYKREKQREYRSQQKSESVDSFVDKCGQCGPPFPQAEAEAEADKDQNIIVGSKLPPCPHEKIIALYHEMLPELPRVRTWTTTRRRHLQSRWREYPDLEDWKTFFSMVKKSPFLMGEIQNSDRRPFRASLDWLIKPENFAKTIEGKYRG